MVVPPEALAKARSLLESATRPIFLHDDDCDGTTSFVICYQFCKSHKGEGRGVPIKRSPSVAAEYMKKVEEFDADLIVVLDKPGIDAEFLEQSKVPVLWIDHHPVHRELMHFRNLFYLNPRIWDDADNRPTSYWSYQITKTNLWIATVGSVGDWFLPEYITEFRALYPDLAPEEYTKIEDAYLYSPIGTLVRVIQFNLKGLTAEAKKSVLTLTRIESPYEILQQTTSRGRFLWKKYQRFASKYNEILEQARAAATQPGKILLYLYSDDDNAFSSELSNELLIRYPERIVMIARKHDGYVKGSLRSKNVELPPLLDQARKGLDSTGGGHKHACGFVVAEKDWDEFYERFTKLVENS